MGKKWRMAFIPTKFEVNKRNTIISHYTLHDTEPYRWQSKTSWVTINSKLSCKPCVNSVNKKANNTRGPGFLCRHMQGSPRKIEEEAYIPVRPILEYALVLLDPLTQAQAWKIEIVQRRAARFVMSDYTVHPRHSVTQMLQALGWQLTLNRDHGQTSSYWIVPCTILLQSHQHHHACTQVTQPHMRTPFQQWRCRWNV